MSAKRFLGRLRAFIAKPMIVIQQKPILLDDKDHCENPIFLVGVHRSGTSLTRRMFNSHRDIACPPETFYLKHYCDMLRDPLTAAGFHGFGQSPTEMRRYLARQAGELHEAFRIIQGKRRWADKTPQYTGCLQQLLELFGQETRFVLIIRDPRDVAYSIYERRWRFTEEEGDLLDDSVSYVRDSITRMLDFARSEPDKTIKLYYESLVNDPRGELTRVLDFLGEEFDEAMLRFNQSQHNFGTEDPMVRGTSILRLSTGHWETLPDEERVRLSEGLAGVAAELGYEAR